MWRRGNHQASSKCATLIKAIAKGRSTSMAEGGRKGQWYWDCPSAHSKVSCAGGGRALRYVNLCCSRSPNPPVFCSPELCPNAFQPRGLLCHSFIPLSSLLCSTFPAISRCLIPSFLSPKLLILSCIYLHLPPSHHIFWIAVPDCARSCSQLPPQAAVPGSCSSDFENIWYVLHPTKGQI